VIALEKLELYFLMVPLERQQVRNDAARIRPSIDIIAEKYDYVAVD
jgi:hypothetical protein